MNAIELLETQHREVEDLFAALEEAEDADEKGELFDDLADALAVHAAIEERHFYPTVRERRTEDILLESLQEHLAIKRALAALLDLDPGDGAFDTRLRELKGEVEHHVRDEEKELFPKVRNILSADELDSLGDEMLATAEELESGEPRESVREQIAEAPPLS